MLGIPGLWFGTAAIRSARAQRSHGESSGSANKSAGSDRCSLRLYYLHDDAVKRPEGVGTHKSAPRHSGMKLRDT
jgi:hypothetical protein